MSDGVWLGSAVFQNADLLCLVQPLEPYTSDKVGGLPRLISMWSDMAKKITVQGLTGKSTILIGERIENLARYIPREKVVVITDTHVHGIYHDRFPRTSAITIGTGEAIKNLKTVSDIYQRLVSLNAERSSFIVGIGGGIVCDIAGFVASTYLRGVRFGFVSTTLLSQVDASVGGKNGVNFKGYKNIIGVFNQPEIVICDLNLLHTLPEKELSCGFAEIVKHAAIGNAGLFRYLEKQHERALSLDPKVMEKLVYESICLKSDVVNRDERETGERRKLNFGHTIGHAIEKITGMPHGQAVGAGMMAASEISEKRRLLSHAETNRIRSLLSKLKLPTRLEVDPKKLMNAMKKDKKREGDRIHFVLLRGIGDAVVEQIGMSEIESVIKEMVQ